MSLVNHYIQKFPGRKDCLRTVIWIVNTPPYSPGPRTRMVGILHYVRAHSPVPAKSRLT